MNKHTLWIVLGLVAAFSFRAAADVPPPNTEGCRNAAAGDSCRTDEDKRGTCAHDTCSGLDYSHLSDAGVPSSRTYDCLVCEKSNGGCSFAPNGASSGIFAQLAVLLGF